MDRTLLRAPYPTIPGKRAKARPASRASASRIGLVISDLGSGGAQRVLVQLAGAWTKAGREVTVITLAGPERDFFRLPAGVRRIAVGGASASRGLIGAACANLSRVKRLRKALRDSQARVAIAFIMPTAVLTILAAAGLDIRVVACERNDPTRQSFGPVWSALRRLTYPWADVVTANSRGALAALTAFVPSGKLLYVANPLSPPSQAQSRGFTAPTVLSIGRLYPQKAHDVLLNAFALFADGRPGWRLAIMGAGPEAAKLHSLAEALRIGDRVDWLGTQPDPYSWLRSARIFALVSRHEGTPNALLEAMACGLPCIVSDASPGPLELISDGHTGLVVPVGDHDALARQLARLAEDSELSRRLGNAARLRVAEHHADAALLSWEGAINAALEEFLPQKDGAT
jgi:GalNAc-alpha-(1->4)-GalNAc-alpha-(1->3)-diNAcBac-PP-undecaprenol alpha-1,4-N-acetyl-D-galactosaminyltransferase